MIDAQYFSKKDINENYMLAGVNFQRYQKFAAILIFSSVENFQPYYKTYKHLAIGDYENWEEEKWVNVADKDWQEFMDTLVGKLKKRSGWLFYDNCDVYDYAHKKDIFDGLTVILKKIRAMGSR